MRSARRAVLIALCALSAAPAADAAARRAVVTGVVDGDTIRVGTTAVDLLGVRAATGCGSDGAATLRALLPRGTKVRLVRERGRRGAYVFRGSVLVNRELVALGAA